MSVRKRLRDEEAQYLGLEIRNPSPGRSMGKYTLTEDQWEEILTIRCTPKPREMVKTQVKYDKNGNAISSLEKLQSEPIEVPENFEVIKISTSKTTGQQWIQYAPRKEKVGEDLFFKEFITELKEYSHKYPKINRKEVKDGHLLVIDIADLHINKYAEKHITGSDYNSEVAVNRALEGTEGLIRKASGFNIDKILFVIGNDVLNTDNLNKQTTKGTNQDTDLSWYKAFNVAKDCYVKCIELCMQVADVDIIHCPSNHDYMSGCYLAETLSAWFRKSKNITFDIGPKYRKYYKYHNNMIELEHGDKGKMIELPLTMANEKPTMWSTTRFRYAYLHHVHHQDKRQFQSGKDYTGVNVTYLRSPSSADIWHYEQGYHNMVAVEAFIHSKNMGRVSHLTHYF